ncbi:MAG: ABC transporter permease [Flavobacteriales bacterium]
MILRLFLFEARYWLRQPMAYIFIALIAFLTGAAVVSDNVRIGLAVGNVLKNAPYLVYVWYSAWSAIGLLMVTAFVNATAIRDFTSNTAQIVFSTPVSKAGYLIGKFLGSTFVALLPMLGVSLGIIAGSWWPGLDPLRIGPNLPAHHLQAILLFAGAPLWCAILVLAAVNALTGGGAATPTGLLVLLLLATWCCHYAPKLAGYAEVLLRPALAAGYGGRWAFGRGAAAEIAFTTLMEPARLMAQTLFLAALPFGLRMGWAPQNRAERGVTWRDAARQFWPPTVAGLVLGAMFAAASPLALLLAMPVLASLLLAIPFAVVTADPAFSERLRAAGICALPEEITPPRA